MKRNTLHTKPYHLVLVVLASCWLFWTPVVSGQDVSGELLGRINALRAELGLTPYRTSGALTTAALNHAQWMANTGQVSHSQPDGSRPRDRAQAAGYASAWVSENIYLGYGGSVEAAWAFWRNSPVHYAGLTSPNYEDIGIARAINGQNHAFVLVFGNPTGGSGVTVSVAQGTSARSSGGAPRQGAVPGLPPFVVGVDGVGNIMHEIQPGDTLGDIAFTYGYTWTDIPDLLALNGMTQSDIRELSIGSIFLVPPYDGTYTPTPAPATATPTITPTPLPTNTPSPVATATPLALPPPVTYVAPTATVALVIRPLGTSVAVAPIATATPTMTTATPLTESVVVEETSPEGRQSPPFWLIGAIVLQVGVLMIAIVALIRRK